MIKPMDRKAWRTWQTGEENIPSQDLDWIQKRISCCKRMQACSNIKNWSLAFSQHCNRNFSLNIKLKGSSFIKGWEIGCLFGFPKTLCSVVIVALIANFANSRFLSLTAIMQSDICPYLYGLINTSTTSYIIRTMENSFLVLVTSTVHSQSFLTYHNCLKLGHKKFLKRDLRLLALNHSSFGCMLETIPRNAKIQFNASILYSRALESRS